jgi:hypothetical protein
VLRRDQLLSFLKNLVSKSVKHFFRHRLRDLALVIIPIAKPVTCGAGQHEVCEIFTEFRRNLILLANALGDNMVEYMVSQDL